MLAAAVSAVTGVVLSVLATVVTEARADRWDPPWLQLLVGVALLLAILAFLWWVFLVARLQDLFRDEAAPRRIR